MHLHVACKQYKSPSKPWQNRTASLTWSFNILYFPHNVPSLKVMILLFLLLSLLINNENSISSSTFPFLQIKTKFPFLLFIPFLGVTFLSYQECYQCEAYDVRNFFHPRALMHPIVNLSNNHHCFL